MEPLRCRPRGRVKRSQSPRGEATAPGASASPGGGDERRARPPGSPEPLPSPRRTRTTDEATAAFAMWVLFLAAVTSAQARSAGDLPRYETAYACEGKTLKIECRNGEVINLIRANYGRFSITICNDHGNTEWNVDCRSSKSYSVLHSRCSMNQNCSILASTDLFGDPCNNTFKYLEAHYQCTPATTSSSAVRPSPPWLITSQPSVWRSTVPTSIAANSGIANGPPSSGSTAEKPRQSSGVYHLAPPTLKPQLTLPPDVNPGVVMIKNDGHSPEVEKHRPNTPKETVNPVKIEDDLSIPDQTIDDADKSVVTNERPRIIGNNDQNTRDGFTENPVKKTDEISTQGQNERNKNPTSSVSSRGGDGEHTISEIDNNKRHHHHNHHENPDTAGQPLWRHCSPQSARGLQWNWTSIDDVAVQSCPGGATGFARWRCVSSAHRLSHLQQQRRLGSPSRDSGISSQSRSPLLLDTLGADSLLTGRDIETHSDLTDLKHNIENLMLPEPLASSSEVIGIQKHISYDGLPVWISENPDLSECRSIWLNNLEMRIKNSESLLSISNDLAQVTSSKTLYGGDMMTTTNIIKRLAQKMATDIESFPDTRQREAMVTELLHGVVRTGSNLLDVTQQASWKDLSHPAQMRVATSLLIGLEENAFLLAGAILREKSIVQQAKNILISVTVLKTRNVETEEFPSSTARQKWTASEDSIFLPRGALIDNSEGGLVRIVYVAFDRLEEILQPPPAPTTVTHNVVEESFLSENLPNTRHQQMNSEKDRDNITRIVNSKIISASLGKGRHIQLSQPVRLTLHHLHTENVTNPTCVFWDYTVNVWSTEGCHVEWTNRTHTGCQCTHLTNFALLMDVHSVPLSPANALALNIITLVGCSISVIALIASMIVFQCVGSMKSDRVTIHKNLCACLLLAELIFMFGIEWTSHRILCGIIAALLHYFFLAAFAWMFLEGFQLYAMLVEVFEPERARACWYYLFAYLIPFIIVGISSAVDAKSYGTPHHCWLSSENYFNLSFIGPAAFVLIANWLILALVIYMMCRHSNVSVKSKENNKLYKIRVWVRSAVMLMILLGLTWTFGLLYINQETVVMAFIFTIFNSLQGLFIFIFHCLKNEMFQKECGKLGRRHPWLSCCLRLAPAVPTGPLPATTSSNAAGSVPQCQQPAAPISTSSTKHPRYHQDHIDDQSLEDVSDRDHPTGHNSTVSASTTNNLVINNLNVVVNNNNHNNNHVINNAAVASLAAAAAAHSYHQHRNRRNSSQYNNSQNTSNCTDSSRECNQPTNHSNSYFGGSLNSQEGSPQINPNVGSPNTSAPMSHLRNPLNIGHPPGQRHPTGYRHNLQQAMVPQRYTLKQQQQESSRSWNNATMVHPSAPPLQQPQADNTSAPHSLSMPSIHNNGHNSINHNLSKNQNYGYSQNQTNRVGTPVPAEMQHDYPNNVDVNRSRSPSCFSVKMATNIGSGEQNNGWGVVQNPLSAAGVSGSWKNTSSKHHPGLMNTLQHQDHSRRGDHMRPYQRYDHDTTRSAHSQRHHHLNPHSHSAYSDIPHYVRGANSEYRAKDEPEYEEIDRNETLMSDMSDDNSGHGERCIRNPDLGLQGGSYNLHGDSRPLISYSPGESHRYDHSPVALDHQIPHGRYNINRWDSFDRHPDRRNYDYHSREIGNPRTLAAVLNRENNVVCHVEPHAVTEALYPGHGHLQRAVLPPYSDC